MRLNRFLAAAGQGSRRSCEELILSGQVTINGVTCTSLATKVAPNDVVKVRNKVMHVARHVTLLLHKPAGFLCTASDTHDRRTIFDLLPKNFPRVFHVGRLDMESEGLLIVTNDGDLALQLTHPRYKVDKEYEVVLDQPFDFTLADKMVRGISTPEGHARAASVHRLGSNKAKVVLRQGLKRQIRLMFYALGYEVVKLTRTRIGPVKIQGMPPGSWRELTQREIESLLASRSEEAPAPRPAKQARPFREKNHPAATPRPSGSARPPKRSRAGAEDEEQPVWSGEWEGDWEKEWATFESSESFEAPQPRRPARGSSSHPGEARPQRREQREYSPRGRTGKAPDRQGRDRGQREPTARGGYSSREPREPREARDLKGPRSSGPGSSSSRKQAPGFSKDSRPKGERKGKPTSRGSRSPQRERRFR